MRIEQLDTRLILQVDATQPQGVGRSVGEAWREPVDVAPVWAAVRNLTGREIQTSQLATGTAQYQVTIRWRNDISRSSRFAWRQPGKPDRFLYVVHVPLGARAEFISLLCEENV